MGSLLKRHLCVAGFIVAGSLIYAAPAAAQATRTWVSGVGDDANPCSRTAPCKTFAGAISKTAAGGEINCIDQGAYGAVTITKSIALVCVGVTAGVLHSSTNGVVINAAATDDIFIKGLDINGSPPTSPGLNGIRFLAGASLTVEDTLIRGSTGASPNGYGILFAPSGAAKLVVKNSILSKHGTAGTGGGILIQPTGTGSALVQLDNVSIANTAGVGVRADATGNTGTTGISVQLSNVQLVGNSVGLFLFAPAGNTAPIKAMVVGSTISNNTAGVLANGTPITALFSDNTITSNGQGVTVSGATVLSYQDNRLFGNTSGNTFPGTLPKN
jgi:nitrous oxidase accessory protein NosD